MIDINDLEWKEAHSKDLSDYDIGDLCKDSAGNLFLIGHVECMNNSDGGCGCCSEVVTENDIVEYAKVITIPEDS